jgi:two-component system response regulator CpxR
VVRTDSSPQSAAEAPRPLLLIDDDAELCSLMSEYFSQNNLRLECVYNGRDGLQKALLGGYELVILDVMLPNLNGFEVLRQLRQHSSVPVIMLTARTQPQDRINGLESGADDYLPKPFEPDELLARIRAVLRRSHASEMTPRTILKAGDIELNASLRELRRRGENIELTSVEFSILELLMRSAGRIVSRDEIAAALYQREATPYERSLDVHISHLRKKLEDDGHIYIRTVRGSGYIFSAG